MRLIDADMLKRYYIDNLSFFPVFVKDAIDKQPTVEPEHSYMTESVNLLEEMRKRNLTVNDLMEYMWFEDECISKGYTFKSILEVLEAREKCE